MVDLSAQICGRKSSKSPRHPSLTRVGTGRIPFGKARETADGSMEPSTRPECRNPFSSMNSRNDDAGVSLRPMKRR